MALGNVRKLLLGQVLDGLPADARIVLCCAGKYLARNWATLKEVLTTRKLVAILDDAPEKLAAGRIKGLPVKPIDFATKKTVDAILITSDCMEDRMVLRFAALADTGVQVIRTHRIEHNVGVTSAMIESLLEHPGLDLFSRPQPWAHPLPDNPPGAGLEITTGCNLNCLMCETRASRRPAGQMSLDLFQRGLDELEGIGCRGLSYHTIGEPTIHHKFEDILRISHERKFEVFLSTNGIKLNEYAEALVRWPVNIIRFSVDGATKETYERIRVGASFEKLLANLRLMHDTVVEAGLPTELQLDVALSRDNLHELPLFYEVFGAYVDECQIRFSLVNSLAAGDHGYYDAVKLVDDDVPMVPCSQLWEVLYVGHDGRVSACCRDYHGELIVGDLRDQSLHDIWHGESLAGLRAGHVAGNVESLPASCQTCYCAGSGRSDLLSFLISAMRRSMPDLTGEAFIERLQSFIEKLSRLRKSGAVHLDRAYGSCTS